MASERSRALRAELLGLQQAGEGGSGRAGDICYQLKVEVERELQAAQQRPLRLAADVVPLEVALHDNDPIQVQARRTALEKELAAMGPGERALADARIERELSALDAKAATFLAAPASPVDPFAADRARARSTYAQLLARNPMAAAAFAERAGGLLDPGPEAA